MSSDPEAVIRRDFPIVRRGYDPAAVDAHLQALADAGLAAGQAPAVSSQVQAILTAAEAAAAEIERDAREQASRLTEGAAERAKADAGRLAGATDTLGTQIESIEREIGTLLGELRTRVEAIGAAIAELETGVDAAFATEQPAAPPATNGTRPAANARTVAATPVTPTATAAAEPPDEPESGSDESTRANARLVALDMALSGRSRAEIDSQLAQQFGALSDRAGLVDEVVAAAGG